METKLKAPREKFDPTKKENWHFHDEYEFWYIEYPECREVSGPHWLDKTRDCSFFPWEHIADASPDPAALVEALRTSNECLKDLHGMYLEKGHPNESIITAKIGQQIAYGISALALFTGKKEGV